ncbi:hypothetical protein FRX31_020263, partial [Thalictrum thalictroides]
MNKITGQAAVEILCRNEHGRVEDFSTRRFCARTAAEAESVAAEAAVLMAIALDLQQVHVE